MKYAEELIEKYFNQNAFTQKLMNEHGFRSESKDRLIDALRTAYKNKLKYNWSLNIPDFLSLCAAAACCFTIDWPAGEIQKEAVEQVAILIQGYPNSSSLHISSSVLNVLNLYNPTQVITADSLKWNYKRLT